MAQKPLTQTALQTTQNSVRAILESRRKQIASVLESEPRAERLILSGMIAVAEMKDHKTQAPIAHLCDSISIARSIMQAAMLGIDLTAGLGEGWLIKYGNQCTLSPGYRCWQRAAQSAGYDVVFDVVREGDEFSIGKIPPEIMHRPQLAKQGDIIGAYAAAYRQGVPAFQPDKLHSVEWCSKDELDQAQAASKSSNSPAWSNWRARMNRKLPLVRIVKDLPVDWTGRNAKLVEAERISEQGGGYDIDFDDHDSIVNGGSLAPEPQPENAPQAKTRELMAKRKQQAEPAHDPKTGEVARKSEALMATLAGIANAEEHRELLPMATAVNKLKGQDYDEAKIAYNERKFALEAEREPGSDG